MGCRTASSNELPKSLRVSTRPLPLTSGIESSTKLASAVPTAPIGRTMSLITSSIPPKGISRVPPSLTYLLKPLRRASSRSAPPTAACTALSTPALKSSGWIPFFVRVVSSKPIFSKPVVTKSFPMSVPITKLRAAPSISPAAATLRAVAV